jgi:hypothetical protein
MRVPQSPLDLMISGHLALRPPADGLWILNANHESDEPLSERILQKRSDICDGRFDRRSMSLRRRFTDVCH